MRVVCTLACALSWLVASTARADEPLPPLSTSGQDVTLQGPVSPVVTGPKPPPPLPPPGKAPSEDGSALKVLHGLVRNDARIARSERYLGGGLALGMGALIMGAGAVFFADAQHRATGTGALQRAFGLGLVTGGAAAFITGGISLFLPSRMENLDERLSEIEADPKLSAVHKLGGSEAALTEAASADKFDRTLGGAAYLVLSAASLMVAGGLATDGDLSGTQRGVLALSFGLIGCGALARGIWTFVAERGPAERLLRTWQTGTGRVVGRLELTPTVMLLPGAVGAGFVGAF